MFLLYPATIAKIIQAT